MSQGDLSARERKPVQPGDRQSAGLNLMAGQLQGSIGPWNSAWKSALPRPQANEWLERKLKRKQADEAVRKAMSCETHDQLENRNRRWRAHEFVRSTLEQTTSLLYLALRSELLVLLEQAQMEFNRLQ
jgi:hypothetical protein